MDPVKLWYPRTPRLHQLAIIPGHYERDQKWQNKSGNNAILQSPNRLSVNINDKGLALTIQQELDLSASATWDTTTPTDYTVAANRAGKDFYVYACTSTGTHIPILLASANSTFPSGYTANNSRKIAGFHCLCVATGVISGHSLTGYLAGDLLPLSIWDLQHLPISGPEGMVYSQAENEWVDIYLASGTGANTTSVYAASFTATRTWMDFVDDGHAVSKQLLSDSGFQAAAAGSNEETNIAGSADPGTTGGHSDTAGRRMISAIGCEDCCGVGWQWLDEQSYRADSLYGWGWFLLPGNKGQLYRQGSYGDVKIKAGGDWDSREFSGSRGRKLDCDRWDLAPDLVARFRADPEKTTRS